MKLHNFNHTNQYLNSWQIMGSLHNANKNSEVLNIFAVLQSSLKFSNFLIFCAFTYYVFNKMEQFRSKPISLTLCSISNIKYCCFCLPKICIILRLPTVQYVKYVLYNEWLQFSRSIGNSHVQPRFIVLHKWFFLKFNP